MFNETEPKITGGLHFGNRYQALIGVSRLIDLLNGDIDSVTFEQKESDNDKFDDLKTFSKNEIHHYQVKGSYVDNELTISIFKNQRIHLSFPELILSWKELNEKFPKLRNFFHIYTTKTITPTDPLTKYVRKIDDGRIKFSENKDAVYCLNADILDEETLKDVVIEVRKNFNETQIKEFLNSLILETNQPPDPPTKFSPEIIVGPLAKNIESKIENLGLHKPPNNMQISSIYATLFHLVNRQSIPYDEITIEKLKSHLRIKQNFDSIDNSIEFDDSQYVETKNSLQILDSEVNNQTGSILAIYGKPGSGKTWLLTKWMKNFRNQHINTPPIWHYSFVSATEDKHLEIRITKQQLINNLVHLISENYNLEKQKNKFAATPETLQNYLNQIGEIAIANNIVIPVIVDGLDHILRVKERASSLSKEDETVLDFLKEVKIPKGICFVFGTQMGDHLDDLKSKYGDNAFFEITGFDEPETKEYLVKSKVPDELFTNDRLSTIYQITDGLPLLVNYLSNILLELQDFEKIKEIPLTQGNVAVYYQYLWNQIESKPFTRILAKYLGLLEFPGNADFLESLYPKKERDYEELDACLKPLLPLLRFEEDEISLFHNSFREFILENTDLTKTAKEEYSEKIYLALAKYGLIKNLRAFRYALKYAFNANKFDDIIDNVNLEFIDEAIKNINNRKDVFNNLQLAIRSANEKQDSIKILEKALLKKYTVERFDTLDLTNFDNMIFRLYPEKISSLLLYEKSLNLTLLETISTLADGLRHKLDLPYKKVVKIWNKTISKTDFGQKGLLPKDISIVDYAIILCYVDDFNHVVSWIDKNDFSFNQMYSIIKEVVSVCSFEDVINSEISGTKLEANWNVFLPYIFHYYEKFDEFKDHFKTYKVEICTKNLPEFRHFLKISEISPEEIESNFQKIDIEIPERGNINVNDLLNFEKQVSLAAYLDSADGLDYYKKLILEKRDCFFSRVLNLIFHTVLLSIKKLDNISNDDVDSLYDVLMNMMNYDQQRLFDEPGYNDHKFQKYISAIIEESIKIILLKSNISKHKELVENSRKFSMKYMFTSISRDNFLELIIKYSKEEEIRRKIIELAEAEIQTYETQDMIGSCLDTCSLFLKLEERVKAIEFFNKTIILSHSYGWRKDIFLFEILEMFDCLNEIKSDGQLSRYGFVLKYTEFLDVITDHSEVHGIPTRTIQKMLKYNSNAALKAILQYGVDSHRCPDIVSEFCRMRTDCNSILRYFLLKTIIHEADYSENNTEGLFDDKIKCISDTITSDREKAKKLLDDLRLELLRDYPETEKKFESKFNELAAELQIPQIVLKNAKETKEKADRDKPKFSDNPEELYNEYERLYGWSGWSNGRYTELLSKAFEIDSEKTNLLINAGITEKCLTHHWEVIGMIEEYSRFLKKTNQKEKLHDLTKKISLFFESLFRERSITPKHDFDWLEHFSEEDDPNNVGFTFLLEQLRSSDIEVQKRAFVSMIRCLEFKIPDILNLCVKKLIDEETDFSIKEKLAGVLDSYVTSSKDNSSLIQQSIDYLKNSKYRNLIMSGEHIESQIGENL